jgi:flagellar protein FlaG
LTGEEVRQVSEEMAGKMNQVASVFNTKLSFSVDNVTGKTVIRVMNSETNEVIRQIPPEHMLQLVSKMRDVMGMVLNIEI